MELNIKKATFYTSIFILLVTISLLLILYLNFMGEPPLNHGEAWGLIVISTGLIFLFMNVTIGFPIAGKITQNRKNGNYFIFIIALFFITALFSIASVFTLGVIGYGFEVSTIVHLGLKVFSIIFILCLPLSILWWRFAKKNR